jgi:uncharacterized protein DUF3892
VPDVQVTCIRKSNPAREHEHITHLGGHGWKWPVAQVIRSIESLDNTFYVIDPRTKKRSELAIVRPEGKKPYVRTHADGDMNDNLLGLPPCL